MRGHNQPCAHTFLRLFIFVQKATLRFFNYHSLISSFDAVFRVFTPDDFAWVRRPFQQAQRVTQDRLVQIRHERSPERVTYLEAFRV
jgi:hypothetical protein